MKFLISVVLLAVVPVAFSHKSSPGHHSHTTVIPTDSYANERSHIQHHMGGLISQSNLNRMAENELRFMYFKMHDSDGNNKLDGCELVKSLLHWHAEDHGVMNSDHTETVKIFYNDELSMIIDPVLRTDDKNYDGFIDYSEFVAAHESRGF